MENLKATLETIIAQRLPLEVLFDGQGASCTGRLTGLRRSQEGESLTLEVVSGDAPRTASVARCRVVIDRSLHEFASVVVRRLSDPFPVFVIRYPADMEKIERRVHHRVEASTDVSLRVAVTLTSEWIPVEIHNLSVGGVAFSSSRVKAYAVGHTVARMELTVDDQPPILTSGVVRNVYTIRYPREVGPVFGVQWGRLTPEESARVSAYVEARRRKPA